MGFIQVFDIHDICVKNVKIVKMVYFNQICSFGEFLEVFYFYTGIIRFRHLCEKCQKLKNCQ